MKKYIAAAAVMISLGLTACGANVNSESTETTPADTQAAVDAAETEADIDAEENADTDAQPAEEVKAPLCADITAAILESVEFPSMAEIGTDRVGMYLDYEIPEGSDFSMFICGSGGFADEVCVISCADLDENAFQEAVEKRIESRKKDFEGYNPDEYDKLDDFYMGFKGDYFIYAVTNDNDVCESIFAEYVK